jgi:ribosomal protein S8E
MNKLLIGVATLILFGCHTEIKNEGENSKHKQNSVTGINGKIRVLNFGTAHLSQTSDANFSQIDLNDPNEKADLTKLVEKIVEFKPTIICLELEPKNNDYIASTYSEYVKDQTKRLNYSDELNSIGLEVARLCGTNRIYGIDSQAVFDYPSLVEIANKKVADSLYISQIMDNYQRVNALKFKEQFRTINTGDYKMETFDLYNFLATQHTPGNQEGVEEIAKFYQRNLKMYSNFNDIEMTENDRVFILLGATHTAYFDVFLKNNPKFQLENPNEYTDY